jgi:hypothetical protein
MAGGKPGNKNALKWTRKKLESLCEKLLEIAKEETKKRWTLKQIALDAGSTYKIVKHLGDTYPIVSDTIDEVQAILQSRWLIPALGGTGHGAIIKQFLNYHSQEVADFEDERTVKQAERIEEIKMDAKVRLKEALEEKENEELRLTPQQALLVSNMITKGVKEKLLKLGLEWDAEISS